MMRRTALLLSLLALACAGAPRVAPPVGGGDASAERTAAVPVSFPFDELSRAAFDLLSESAVDSCSICAREAREEAFRILNETIRPGAVLRGGPDCPFLAAPDAGNEFLLSCFAHGELTLLFRAHTAANRLVGIESADLTPDSLAGRPAAAARIIPFPYGDGDAFLYHPAENRLEVMVRPLPRAAAGGKAPLAPGASGGYD